METETNAFEFVFEDSNDDDESPDVYVTETFTDRWGTERAVLDGETYEAKEIIKFDWETTHHKFDGSRKAWLVDADSLDELAEKLAEGDYSFADLSEGAAGDGEADVFDELLESAAEGDRIEVTYAKKNGNGSAVREGKVFDSHLATEADRRDPYAPDSRLMFRDSEGKTKRLARDDRGRPSIYSSGYYPYMGSLESVRVEIAENEAERAGDEKPFAWINA